MEVVITKMMYVGQRFCLVKSFARFMLSRLDYSSAMGILFRVGRSC